MYAVISKSTAAQSSKESAKYSLIQLADVNFEIMLDTWKFCNLCFEGESAIKANADTYICKPKSKEKDRRKWLDYISRGKWPTADSPAQTLEKMIGILGAKSPEVTLEGKATALEFLKEYATPYRDGLDGLFLRAIEQVLRNGRYCFLLEPNADDNIGFHINEYRADKFLRAEVTEKNGESYANLVLLDTSNITFSPAVWRDVYYPQITLLALDANGNYYQAKFGSTVDYNAGAVIAGYDNGRPKFQNIDLYHNAMGACIDMLESWDVLNPDQSKCTELIYPTRYNKTLDRIPFTVCNTNSLHLKKFSTPPLLQSCLQALHILQADCDHQQAIYYTTDPIPVAKGLDKEDELPVSADQVLYVPVDGDFGFVTTGGTGLAEQRANLDQMREELRACGVSLAGTEGAINTSGIALEIFRNSQTASLRIINSTVGKAIEEQLRFAGKWIGMKEADIATNIRFTPANDFAEPKPGIAELNTLANVAKQYSITPKEMRALAEKHLGLEVRDFDELQAELEAEAEANETNNFANMVIPPVVPQNREDSEEPEEQEDNEKTDDTGELTGSNADDAENPKKRQ